MSAQKDMIRTFYERMWNGLDKSLVPELMSEDVSYRTLIGDIVRGRDSYAAYMDKVAGPFSNFQAEILDMIEEGDRVAVKLRFTAEHTGEFLGHAPSGKNLSWEGSTHFTFANGAISDIWVLGDIFSLEQSLKA
ncbi:MAG: ester cyclase [Pseudomonadota bacterium]